MLELQVVPAGARRLAATVALTACPLLAHAGLVLTLTHDGSGGVVASVSGSGTISSNNLPAPEPRNRLLIDDIGPGSPFNSNLNFVGFSLASPLTLAPGLQITGLIPDDDGSPGLDDFFMPLSADLTTTPVAFNASGSAQVIGLQFADLTVGSYSNPNYAVSVELGGFTLVIRDAQVPEPSSIALVAAALLVAGQARRRSKA